MIFEVNTKYGKLIVSRLFSENGVTTYECYDEIDQYYGMVKFQSGHTPTSTEVETQLSIVRGER